MEIAKGSAKEHRKQAKESCPQRGTAERGKYAEACQLPGTIETDITNTKQTGNGLLEQILTADNLNHAYKQVKRNQGASGVDGMQVEALYRYLKANREELVQSLREGKYQLKTSPQGRNTQRKRQDQETRNPHRRRSLDPTGNLPGAHTHLRKTILGQQLWLSTEARRP